MWNIIEIYDNEDNTRNEIHRDFEHFNEMWKYINKKVFDCASIEVLFYGHKEFTINKYKE